MKMSSFKIFSKITIVVMFLLMVAYSMPVTAEESYGRNTGKKLTRGVANILTGWVEFPKQIYQVSRDDNVIVGITFGTVKGVAQTIARTGAGVYETGTFFAPVPSDYEPIKDPEYVWNDWSESEIN